jgi:hypothetical protein
MSDETTMPALPMITLPEGYVPVEIAPPPEGAALGLEPGAAVPAPAPREPLPYTYNLLAGTDAVLRSDGLRVENWPCPEREEYEFWRAAGGEPGAAVLAGPVVPQAVTMRQARLALHGAGLLPLVDAAIDSMPEPVRSAARIEWEYSQEVQRHRGFVAQLGAALGLDDAALDGLFVAAAQL